MSTPIAAHRLLVIQDATITSMASQQRFLAAFPFLKSARMAQKTRGCGTCGSGNKRRAGVFTDIKKRIASMSSSKKLELKKLLNTEKVRLLYRRDDNKNVEHTF